MPQLSPSKLLRGSGCLEAAILFTTLSACILQPAGLVDSWSWQAPRHGPHRGAPVAIGQMCDHKARSHLQCPAQSRSGSTNLPVRRTVHQTEKRQMSTTAYRSKVQRDLQAVLVHPGPSADLMKTWSQRTLCAARRAKHAVKCRILFTRCFFCD